MRFRRGVGTILSITMGNGAVKSEKISVAAKELRALNSTSCTGSRSEDFGDYGMNCLFGLSSTGCFVDGGHGVAMYWVLISDAVKPQKAGMVEASIC